MSESDTRVYPSGFKHWPPDWPGPENHVIQEKITHEQYYAFAKLVNGEVSEREIERFLSDNREVLSMVAALFHTGHHMSWLYPKEQIRPPSGAIGGLIPDYLLAGASSNGVEWLVLELKGADARAFDKRRKRVRLSREANEGICQLLNYIDYATRNQAYMRDELKLTGFRDPRGVLLIGTEVESNDPQVQDFKRAWNQYNPTIKIQSYNRILRQMESDLSLEARPRVRSWRIKKLARLNPWD
jgi:Domain of unknown function (DUF4263)